MALFNPVAFISPNYRDFGGYFLKAFIPNTTTPKLISIDAVGTSTFDKVELDVNGFPTTDGSTLFIPYINGLYDIWLFPTAAEADANDTVNALKLADDINPNALGAENAGNAKDFGATGDGVTDDTISLQAWADGGGRLYLPRGVYRTTATITFREFSDVFGETAGVGSGGGSWPTLLDEAALGASIIAPDTVGFTGDAVFLAENPDPDFKALPSISFRNFKIQALQAGGVQAHLLHIINAYDAVSLSNLNLMFVGADHNALRMEHVPAISFPSISQTGVIENIVCIGDDLSAATTTPTVYFKRQQEMQIIGLKSFGGAQALSPKPARSCIAVDSCRGLTFIGCSSAVCDEDAFGLDIYAVNKDIDGISVTGHTFEDCAPLGTGSGGAWNIDAFTRLDTATTASKVYITDTRYQFPQPIAGRMKNSTQCTVDAGSAEVYITDSSGSNTVRNLFQSKVFDTSGNSSNTVISPTGVVLSGRHYSQALTVQKDTPSMNLVSKDESEGWRLVAGVATGVDNGFTIRMLDGTIMSTQLANGSLQLNTIGRGIQTRSPDDSKFFELRVLDDGTVRVRDPNDSTNFNINNDIPITSGDTTFSFDSTVVGATIRRDSGSANTVRIPEDATAFPINGVVCVVMTGAGPLTIDGVSGVTINGVLDGSTLVTGFAAGVRPAVVLTKIGANDWELVGSADAVT